MNFRAVNYHNQGFRFQLDAAAIAAGASRRRAGVTTNPPTFDIWSDIFCMARFRFLRFNLAQSESELLSTSSLVLLPLVTLDGGEQTMSSMLESCHISSSWNAKARSKQTQNESAPIITY